MNVKSRMRIRFCGYCAARCIAIQSGANIAIIVMIGCCATACMSAGCVQRERDAERGDDDADEDEAVGATHERRPLLAGANEGPGVRDTHVGTDLRWRLGKYTPETRRGATWRGRDA